MNFQYSSVRIDRECYDYHKVSRAQRTQHITPKTLNRKNWTAETDYRRNQTLANLDNSLLTVEVKYNGVENHLFKAYVLETSTSFQSSFAIIIEDTEEDADAADGVKFATLKIDLKNFSCADSRLDIYERVNGQEITLLARITPL